MTTTAQLIDRTRQHLLSSHREEYNSLSAAITTTTATTFTTNDALGGNQGMQTGSIVEIGLEQMYVRSVTGSTATVYRGWNGTTAATHLIQAIVSVNPRFPKSAILQALNDDLADLSGQGLFWARTIALTSDVTKAGYDLTGVTSVDGILAVKYDEIGPLKYWPEIGARNFELRRESNLTDFPSGFALVVKSGVDPGGTIRVTYASSFGTLATLTDTVETTAGLHSEAMDLPPLGAALRLGVAREISRNFWETSSGSNRDDNVPAGASLSAVGGIARLRQQRLATEVGRLRARYPRPRY